MKTEVAIFPTQQVGDDKVIKQWSMEQSFDISLENSQTPINTIIGKVLLKKKCIKQSYEGSIPVRLKTSYFSLLKI